MKVLVIMPSLDPALGGPQASVRSWCRYGRAYSLDFEVLTLDPPDSPWLNDLAAPVHAIGAGFTYYRFNRALVRWLRVRARQYDAVIVSGLWRFSSLGTWLALRRTEVPYFVFPHGMLDPWFRHAHPLKHMKKLCLWHAGERFVLRDARAVLFTAEEERLLARRSFWPYRATELVTGFGVEPPPDVDCAAVATLYERHPELRNKRTLVSLGRIDKKKGLDLVIAAAAKCPDDIHFLFVGPDSPYQRELAQMMWQLGVTRRITWAGPLYGPWKWAALRLAEAFILPSHSENFGVAIVEAMACGLPVLISDKVNIWREIAQECAGIVFPDNADGVMRGLGEWIGLDQKARARMSLHAERCFRSHFSMSRFLANLAQLLRGLTFGTSVSTVSNGTA